MKFYKGANVWHVNVATEDSKYKPLCNRTDRGPVSRFTGTYYPEPRTEPVPGQRFEVRSTEGYNKWWKEVYCNKDNWTLDTYEGPGFKARGHLCLDCQERLGVTVHII